MYKEIRSKTKQRIMGNCRRLFLELSLRRKLHEESFSLELEEFSCAQKSSDTISENNNRDDQV